MRHVSKSAAWDVCAQTIKQERTRIADWLREDLGTNTATAMLAHEIASAIEGGTHTAWHKVRRND